MSCCFWPFTWTVAGWNWEPKTRLKHKPLKSSNYRYSLTCIGLMVRFLYSNPKTRKKKIILSRTTLPSTTPEAKSWSNNIAKWSVYKCKLTSARKFVTKMAYLIWIETTTTKLNSKAAEANCTRTENQSGRDLPPRKVGVSLFPSLGATGQSGGEFKWAAVIRAGFRARHSPSCFPFSKAELTINEKQGTKGI